MPRTKASGKETKKPKAKTSAKPKAKTKQKPKGKIKTPKKKIATKVKAHAKPKTSVHAKKTRTKTKSPKRSTHVEFNDTQTDVLLSLVGSIINLHKRKQNGLRSFYMIDRILDKYNQHYPHPEEKLDAIIKYGMEKDPAIVHEHFYILANGREKDENDLYQLLASMGKGKIQFEDAKEKMRKIYEESSHKK